ncbi:hypothetical protein DSO57_1004382 [Entomophthora muscae]|uniref:Uncharacterized protein n=1 Tax=Entomophthora muscae TaxID=34485 RepID=A0ACC2U6A3_9FUNG|nr:hypothetical protein DSO57_1004382 [Entomophthora muscae]
MKPATFRDFEGKPLGILCQDGLVITGLAQSLDPDNGNLTLRQATTFLHGSVIRKQIVVVNRDSVVDACVLPASEELGTMPDMRHFPSLKNAPNANDARYESDRSRLVNSPPRRSESEYRRPSGHPQANNAYEISEDDFEKILNSV